MVFTEQPWNVKKQNQEKNLWWFARNAVILQKMSGNLYIQVYEVIQDSSKIFKEIKNGLCLKALFTMIELMLLLLLENGFPHIRKHIMVYQHSFDCSFNITLSCILLNEFSPSIIILWAKLDCNGNPTTLRFLSRMMSPVEGSLLVSAYTTRISLKHKDIFLLNKKI